MRIVTDVTEIQDGVFPNLHTHARTHAHKHTHTCSAPPIPDCCYLVVLGETELCCDPLWLLSSSSLGRWHTLQSQPPRHNPNPQDNWRFFSFDQSMPAHTYSVNCSDARRGTHPKWKKMCFGILNWHSFAVTIMCLKPSESQPNAFPS